MASRCDDEVCKGQLAGTCFVPCSVENERVVVADLVRACANYAVSLEFAKDAGVWYKSFVLCAWKDRKSGLPWSAHGIMPRGWEWGAYKGEEVVEMGVRLNKQDAVRCRQCRSQLLGCRLEW